MALLPASGCLPGPLARPPGPSHDLVARRAVQLSAASPFNCGPPGTATRNAAVEPSLAVDPKDPRILIAAWQQDRTSGSGPGGIVTASSTDGGATWRRTEMPKLTTCNGGPYAGTSDPWVSIGPDGTAYLTALALQGGAQARFAGIVVSSSSDHGGHWSDPVPVVANSDPLNAIDKEVVLADSRIPGTVYCAWVLYRLATPSDPPKISSAQFARSTDGGRTWSRPQTTYGSNTENQNHLLNQLPDGTLVDTFTEASELPGPDEMRPLPVQVRAMRSTDRGATWAAPVTAATFTDTAALDPGDRHGLRLTGQEMAAAASPDGSLYVSWFEDDLERGSKIFLSRSPDGGRSWDAPVTVASTTSEVLPPTLAVAGDGTVGILYYDFRGYHGGTGSLTTDAWLRWSHDRGRTWREVHLGGPFDLRTAPLASGGPFVGDYEGLVGLPKGFAAAFGMARPAAAGGSAAIFFASAR